MEVGQTWRVLCADCVTTMSTMDEASVEAIVTDPPYDLGFMGHQWDTHGIAFTPETWRQALRVLKPGGYLLAFGGSRTYHRMTVAIEDAGFAIRDCIMWVHGEGMPKSHDVAAAIDKLAGYPPRGRAIPMASHCQRNGKRLLPNPIGPYEPRTEHGRRWAGWGTALKPAYEPIVVARKPMPTSVAHNVLAHGTGALNVDGCRVGAVDVARLSAKYASTASAGPRRNAVYSPDPRPRSEARIEPHPGGRWPANVVLTHSPACCQVGWQRAGSYTINRFSDGAKPFGGGAGHPYENLQVSPQIVPVFDCSPGCPVAELGRQSGQSVSHKGTPRSAAHGSGWGMSRTGAEYDDEGDASRYFNVFAWDSDLDAIAYCPKATTAERETGLDDRFPPDEAGRRNRHHTVKPLALMRHLVRLVTPPGGTVLDPFCGSGTTGMACVFEHFDFVGIELEPSYAELAKARIAHAEALARRGYTVLVTDDERSGQGSLF